MPDKKQYLIASSNNEWYTPPNYIMAVRRVLGSIAFDPFSCAVANTLVGADAYYTKDDDAIMTPWPPSPTVFANPPYERGIIDRAINVIIHNHHKHNSQTIVLVNVATDARWFQQALNKCDAVCFVAKRIRFIECDGKTIGGSNTRGQAFLYFGSDVTAFTQVFALHGTVLKK